MAFRRVMLPGLLLLALMGLFATLPLTYAANGDETTAVESMPVATAQQETLPLAGRRFLGSKEKSLVWKFKAPKGGYVIVAYSLEATFTKQNTVATMFVAYSIGGTGVDQREKNIKKKAPKGTKFTRSSEAQTIDGVLYVTLYYK